MNALIECQSDGELEVASSLTWCCRWSLLNPLSSSHVTQCGKRLEGSVCNKEVKYEISDQAEAALKP